MLFGGCQGTIEADLLVCINGENVVVGFKLFFAGFAVHFFCLSVCGGFRPRLFSNPLASSVAVRDVFEVVLKSFRFGFPCVFQGFVFGAKIRQGQLLATFRICFLLFSGFFMNGGQHDDFLSPRYFVREVGQISSSVAEITPFKKFY